MSAFWADTVVRQFCFKFLDKVALVKCLYKVALVKCGPRFWGAAFCFFIPGLSGSCELLACMSTAQARTKCVSAFWADSGARHFSCKFPSAQARTSVVLGSWARHFPVNFDIKCLLQNVDVHFACAGSHKVWS